MDMEISQRSRFLFCLSCVIVVMVASACASRGPEIETLGFLDDYDELAPGRPGQASLIYIDGQVDFSDYNAILVEPVVAWPGPDGEPVVATSELARNLDQGLRRELAHEFELVDQSRAGVLRLRSALATDTDLHVALEVELLDSVSGQRAVAAVDHRTLETAASTTQTDAWAILIRNRLATFRQFDAAARAREASEDGS